MLNQNSIPRVVSQSKVLLPISEIVRLHSPHILHKQWPSLSFNIETHKQSAAAFEKMYKLLSRTETHL